MCVLCAKWLKELSIVAEPHDRLGLCEGEEVLRQLLLLGRDSLSPLRTGPPALLGAEKQLFKTKSCVCMREREILTRWGPLV